MNKVVVFYAPKYSKSLVVSLEKTAQRAFSELRKNKFYLEIYLIANPAIRSLNRRFRRKDKVTNVLSFRDGQKFPEPSLPNGLARLGEIYLAPDYIRRKKEDIGGLLIHGILHILGYTHNGKRDTIKMEKMELKILQAVSQNP